MITLAYRMMGAILLDRGTFESVENQRSTGPQAILVVLMSSLAAGVGASGLPGPRIFNLLVVAGVAVATWLAWASLILYVGGVAMRAPDTRVDYGQLARTIGFAAAPGLFQIFGLFTSISIPVFVVAWVWMLAAMVVAVRQALDFSSTWRAVGVCTVTLALVLATTAAIGLALQRTVA
ncbi:MAG TPA: YIP1 family protein [Vicinamibacterales bacterium]|nr:YIP1 family protein [Vicinamibacterales bacterium]